MYPFGCPLILLYCSAVCGNYNAKSKTDMDVLGITQALILQVAHQSHSPVISTYWRGVRAYQDVRTVSYFTRMVIVWTKNRDSHASW